MACRFVFDLFDRGVLRKLVLEEDEESEEEESEEEAVEVGGRTGFEGAFGGGAPVTG